MILSILSGPLLWDKMDRCDSHAPPYLVLKKHVTRMVNLESQKYTAAF